MEETTFLYVQKSQEFVRYNLLLKVKVRYAVFPFI